MYTLQPMEKIAIHTQQSQYGWTNRYSYNGSDSWPTTVANDGFVTWGSGDEFLWSDGKPHPVTVNFADGDVNLNSTGTYYVYLWTRAPSYGIYPDALICTLTSNGNGTLTDNNGNNYHEHRWSYSASGNEIRAKCDQTGCSYNTTTLKLTLNADSATYTGTGYAGASVVNEITSVTGAQPGAVQYHGVNSTAYTQSAIAPTDVGTYEASVALGGVTAAKEFSIAKAAISPIVSISGWTYGEEAHTPAITGGNSGNGTVSYSYKKADAADSTYSSVVPTDAGSYTVKAVVAETANYTAGQDTESFTITPRPVTVSGIRAKDKTYDGTNAAELEYDQVTLQGNLDGANLGVMATGSFEDADAGNNKTVTLSSLNLTGSAKANYQVASASQKKTTASILPKSIAVSYIGSDSYGGTYGGTITPAQAEPVGYVENHKPAVTLSYDGKAGDGTVYTSSTVAPDRAGVYTVTASVADKNYNLQSADDYPTTLPFVVWQSTTELNQDGQRLMINGEERTAATLVYGDTLTVVVKPRATGEQAQQMFRLTRLTAPAANQMALYLVGEDGEEQLTAPAALSGGVYTMTYDTTGKALDIGENTVIARFAGNPNMAGADASLAITLKKHELTVTKLTLEARDYTPGDTAVRIAQAELDGIQGTDDAEVDLQKNLCTLAGDDSGDYGEVTLPATIELSGRDAGYYFVVNAGQTLSARALINKAPIDLQVSIDSWVEGQKAQTPVVTGNLGGGAETFRYKPAGKPDAAYQQEPPVKPGQYIVKATVPETENYLAGEATAGFELFPAPPQTGDRSHLLFWLALCLLAGGGILLLTLRRRKK